MSQARLRVKNFTCLSCGNMAGPDDATIILDKDFMSEGDGSIIFSVRCRVCFTMNVASVSEFSKDVPAIPVQRGEGGIVEPVPGGEPVEIPMVFSKREEAVLDLSNKREIMKFIEMKSVNADDAIDIHVRLKNDRFIDNFIEDEQGKKKRKVSKDGKGKKKTLE